MLKKEIKMTVNRDKVEGTVNTTVGGFKENIGKATGNQTLQAEGNVQKTKGQFQKLSGAVLDMVKQFQNLVGIKPKK